MTPSLDLITLLVWLTELRKPVCSWHYQFITEELKGVRINSQGKGDLEQGVGGGASAPSPGAAALAQSPRVQPGSSLNSPLLGLYGDFIT